MKLKTGRKILSFLLTIALLLGLMQGLGLTGFTYDDNPYAALVPTSSDDSNALNNKLISFNGNMWYIIEDNSTAVNSGTVTLLYATFLAKVPFSSSRDHTAYSGSSIEEFLNGYYEGSFVQFSNAIVPTDLNDVSVTGAKLYLLSTAEVQSLPDNIKKIGCDWWLRTQGNGQCGTFVGEFGNIADSVTYVTSSLAARPALQLDLSKVIFSDKTFSLDEDHNFTYTANGSTITAVCSAEDCSLPLVDGRHTATLTIAAPKHNTYGDGKDATAVITDEYRIRGDAKISYQKMNGSNYGTASETAPTDAGYYKASITLGSATASIEYTIARVDPVITLSVPEETQVEGEELTITVGLPEDATGTVTLAIDDEECTAAVSGDGTAEIKIAATPGTHEILVSYSGDDNYNMVSENRIVKIPKYFTSMELEISPEEPVSGEDITVTAFLPDGATGDVTLTVDGIDYTVSVEDGRAVLTVENPATGEHTVTASYPGDDYYTEASAEISFAVNKVTPEVTVTVSPEEPVYGDKVTVTVNYPADATVWSEIPLPPGGMNPAGMITIKLDDHELTTVDGSEGVLVYELPAVIFGAGGHTVKIIFNGDDKYSARAVETAFTVTKKDVTITANNQELIYNGLTQGEGDTVYEDPEIIAQKVTAATLADGDYISQIKLDGQAQDPGIHEGEIVPSNAVILNAAGEDVSSNYNISYSNGDLIIKTTSVPLTINYVYENGNEAAETHTEDVEIFTDYSVNSPEITGYTPDKATIEGTMENLDGVTETVTYTAIEYTATFTADGETVEEVKFTVEDDSIDEPAVPEKEGYEGKWTAYTLAAADITIPAEYTAIEYTATFVDENGETVKEVKFTVEDDSIDEPAVPEKANYTGEWEEYELGASDITIKPVYTLAGETVVKTDSESEITTDYKESKRFAFEPEFVPEGATAHVFYNGEDRGEGTSIAVKEPTDDYTVECKVLDAEGNEIASSGEIKVKVKNSFFDRLKWFFNNFWANMLKTFIEAIIKAC